MVLDEGGRNVASRSPSWCSAYLLGLWMSASLRTSASDAMDVSPPPMVMGGRRFSTGRRRDMQSPQLKLIQGSNRRPGGSP
jgi:hypothetical protein